LHLTHILNLLCIIKILNCGPLLKSHHNAIYNTWNICNCYCFISCNLILITTKPCHPKCLHFHGDCFGNVSLLNSHCSVGALVWRMRIVCCVVVVVKRLAIYLFSINFQIKCGARFINGGMSGLCSITRYNNILFSIAIWLVGKKNANGNPRFGMWHVGPYCYTRTKLFLLISWRC